MALGAIAPVAREMDLIEVVYATGSVDRKVALQIMPRMDAMNHEAEVDRCGKRAFGHIETAVA